MTQKAIDATRSLVTTVGHNVTDSKKGYLDLVRALAEKVQKTQRKLDAISRQLLEKEEKIGELEL